MSLRDIANRIPSTPASDNTTPALDPMTSTPIHRTCRDMVPEPTKHSSPTSPPTLKEFLTAEEDEIYRRYREDIDDERRGPWVAQMVKTFGKLSQSHIEARVLSVTEQPTAPGTPWTAPNSPLATSGDIDLPSAWTAAVETLDGILGRLTPAEKRSFARKVAFYGSNLSMQLAQTAKNTSPEPDRNRH